MNKACLLSTSILGACLTGVADAQTAIGSTFTIGAWADANQNDGMYHQAYFTDSQGGTLNAYSHSVAANDTDLGNPAYHLTVTSSASAAWTSAGAGTVAWRDMGWVHATRTSSGSKLNGFVVLNAPVWSYTFQATSNGYFAMDYDVRGTGNVFGLLGAKIQWSGVGGEQDLTNPYNPTANGTFVRSITAGTTYTVGLFNMGNVFTAPILRSDSGKMDADFNWRVTSVPEPASALGLLIGLPLIRRRRRS